MGIDRFQNTDILVSSKVPVESVQVYSLSDFINLEKNILKLQTGNLDTQTLVESHIFSADKLVHSNEPQSINYQNNFQEEDIDVDILVKPEGDVRLGNLDSGYYSLVYNFVKKLSPTMKVANINSDATELELVVESDNYNLQTLFSLV